MKKINFLLLGVVATLLCTASCTKEELDQVDLTLEDENAIEAQFIIPVGQETDDSSKASCDTCNTKPGDISKFNAALRDSKVQRYTNGGNTKKEYKTAETYCNTSFFTTCNGRMVFKSTSKTNDRVEIRQEKDLSLNNQSIMRFQAKLEDLPTSSSSKGVTIAQIHSDASSVGRPLLRLEYTGNNQLRAEVTDTYVKNEGSVKDDFMVNFNDGDQVYCKLEIKSSGNKVNIYVKNVSTGQTKSRTYTVSSKWRQKDGDFYFKTGAYLQQSGKSPRVSYNRFQFFY